MHTVVHEHVGFNPGDPDVLHIDLNSCFATVEQQANPRLRGRPVGVAAYATENGCILAASIEAKRAGVKTGMRVREGRALCPSLIILPPDPDKYRFVNRALVAILKQYTSDLEVKSIDEMVLHLKGSHALERQLCQAGSVAGGMCRIGWELKKRIKSEIGEWLTVSIGISTNRYLAKIASGLHKPDGLDVITGDNIGQILSGMALEDLCGIKEGYGTRLRDRGITSALAFYQAPIRTLKHAFRSVIGYHWWLRLHGWEADDREFARRSFGNSHALFVPYRTDDVRLHQLLCQLSEKTGRRVRAHGYKAGGIHLSCVYQDRTYWHKGTVLREPVYTGADIYRGMRMLLAQAPVRPVRILAITCFGLTDDTSWQLGMFEDRERTHALTHALDAINDRWGDWTVTPGRMLAMERKVMDRIAFGGVRELEESIFREPVGRQSARD